MERRRYVLEKIWQRKDHYFGQTSEVKTRPKRTGGERHSPNKGSPR